jgi:transposase InsO family protein
MTPIIMDDSHIVTCEQLRAIVEKGERVVFSFESKERRNEWMSQRLSRFHYASMTCTKREKRIILSYLEMVTGLSRVQVKRYALRKKKTGSVKRIEGNRNSFSIVYGPEDIARLIETDNAHGRITGEATKRILERQYSVYGDHRFEIVRHISVSHLYNLRKTRQYVSHSLFIEKTKAVNRDIGERRKPETGGLPGYIRVDSVHQGDLDKEKGVYHINMVDEVSQFEIIGCVEGISEAFLLPLLEKLLNEFPFIIRGFHSDNGGEYVNHVVSKLLTKLMIDQTKSRSGKTTDNALVEGKNGSRIRKIMGHAHIPRRYAEAINQFYAEHLNIYLNFHRPCGFATERVNARGKIIKKYDKYETPFERLQQIPNIENHLKPEITLETLRAISQKESDNACAQRMQKAREKLFKTFRKC